MTGVLSVVAVLVTGCSEREDVDPRGDAPQADISKINYDCPEGQYSELFVNSLMYGDVRPYYRDRSRQDTCISAEQVTSMTSEYFGPLRMEIDAHNAAMDQNKTIIEDFVSETYLSISNSERRLIQILDDNCPVRIEKKVELEYVQVRDRTGSPVPPPPEPPRPITSEDEAGYEDGPKNPEFYYLSSEWEGDFASIARSIQQRYEEIRANKVVTFFDNEEFYGRKDSPFSLFSLLEAAYNDAWKEAYAGRVSDYVYDYADAIVQRCGSGSVTTPTQVPKSPPHGGY